MKISSNLWHKSVAFDGAVINFTSYELDAGKDKPMNVYLFFNNDIVARLDNNRSKSFIDAVASQ